MPAVAGALLMLSPLVLLLQMHLQHWHSGTGDAAGCVASSPAHHKIIKQRYALLALFYVPHALVWLPSWLCSTCLAFLQGEMRVGVFRINGICRCSAGRPTVRIIRRNKRVRTNCVLSNPSVPEPLTPFSCTGCGLTTAVGCLCKSAKVPATAFYKMQTEVVSAVSELEETPT
jgi:hypothetical protein